MLTISHKCVVTLIDNYDSFVYNLSQYCAQLGAVVRVFRNDEVSVKTIPADTTHIIISPGPCAPQQAGVSCEVINHFAGKIPILGVCLGHQCIGEVFGGKIIKAQQLMHGKISQIHHDGKGVFAGININPLSVTRYHSLVVERTSFPKDLIISATLEEDFQTSREGDVMALRHKTLAVEGVQFHPEAFYTQGGMAMLANFIKQKNIRELP